MPLYLKPFPQGTFTFQEIFEAATNHSKIIYFKRISLLNAPILVGHFRNHAIFWLQMAEMDNSIGRSYHMDAIMPSLWSVQIYFRLLEVSVKKQITITRKCAH